MSDRFSQILELVRTQPGLSVPEISTSTKIHQSIVRRYLDRLKAKRLIKQERGKTQAGNLARLSYPRYPKDLAYANADLQKSEEP